MAALIKKCQALGGTCPDKWSCARYYIPEGPAGWLNPDITSQGCTDFLRLAGNLHSPGRNGKAAGGPGCA